MNRPFANLETVIWSDPAGRGIAPLCRAGELERAARALPSARRVAIVTGFFIPAAGAPETDGPPGALALGRALEALGIPVEYWTDRPCVAVLDQGGLAPLHVYGEEALAPEVTHLIAIERPGRAADGRYYSMRGADLTPHVEPLDSLFGDGKPAGAVTIGIGDGGNEVGMGKVRPAVITGIARGATIASVVAADHLIVAGTSNWGAWGLVAGLSLLSEMDLLPDEERARRDLERLLAAGAVDGVTGRSAPTVDGLAWPVHAALLAALREATARP